MFRLEQITPDPAAQKQVEAFYKAHITEILQTIEQKLSGRDYTTGSQFTVADAYLFTIVGWSKWMEIDTRGFKNISAFMKRVFDRPAVQRVLEKEDALDWLQ